MHHSVRLRLISSRAIAWLLKLPNNRIKRAELFIAQPREIDSFEAHRGFIVIADNTGRNPAVEAIGDLTRSQRALVRPVEQISRDETQRPRRGWRRLAALSQCGFHAQRIAEWLIPLLAAAGLSD